MTSVSLSSQVVRCISPFCQTGRELTFFVMTCPRFYKTPIDDIYKRCFLNEFPSNPLCEQELKEGETWKRRYVRMIVFEKNFASSHFQKTPMECVMDCEEYCSQIESTPHRLVCTYNCNDGPYRALFISCVKFFNNTLLEELDVQDAIEYTRPVVIPEKDREGVLAYFTKTGLAIVNLETGKKGLLENFPSLINCKAVANCLFGVRSDSSIHSIWAYNIQTHQKKKLVDVSRSNFSKFDVRTINGADSFHMVYWNNADPLDSSIDSFEMNESGEKVVRKKHFELPAGHSVNDIKIIAGKVCVLFSIGSKFHLHTFDCTTGQILKKCAVPSVDIPDYSEHDISAINHPLYNINNCLVLKKIYQLHDAKEIEQYGRIEEIFWDCWSNSVYISTLCGIQGVACLFKFDFHEMPKK